MPLRERRTSEGCMIRGRHIDRSAAAYFGLRLYAVGGRHNDLFLEIGIFIRRYHPLKSRHDTLGGGITLSEDARVLYGWRDAST